MPLSAGDRLGPYEILSVIGAGGMGEVYRARDTRLRRDVAVKVSHAQFTERFTSEARTIAALNQTNVCHLYDVGPNYLVMEHVEGETLKGPVALDEALPIIQQLIEGLEAAHEKNIIHRDLKPANIKITPEGIVKILDFGLAKAMDPQREADRSLENSPTLTVGATQAGTILGTAAYMSPEQAKGKQADARADIWSFGVVVYELLTGKQPFKGESVVETLAAVIGTEPDFSPVPGRAQRLLRWCLEKDRKKRLASISDARRLLDEPDALVPQVGPSTPQREMRRRWLWPAIAVAALIVAAGSSALWLTRPSLPPPLVSKFTVDAPPGTAFRFDFTATSISPDGRYVVFSVVREGENTRVLFLRALDSLEARMLPGTDDADTPFWSPDNKSIAFFSERKLKRIDLAGGSPLVLCDLSTDTERAEATGAWNRDGVIIFGSAQGLMRVASTGGTPTELTHISAADQETSHVYPQFLPDRNHFIYLARGGNPKTRGIYAASLERPDQRVQIVQTEFKALYVKPTAGSPGQLLFLRDGNLLALPFDADRLRPGGEPVPVASPIGFRLNTAWASFWASENGVLSYRSGSNFDKTSLTWIARDGKRLGAVAPEDVYSSMRISPNGQRLALGRRDSDGVDDTWILDFSRSLMSRFTFDPHRDTWPIWSPDGRRIAFASNRSGVYQLYWKDASGGGSEEQLTTSAYPKVLEDWTRDGKYLLYSEEDPKTRNDIWSLPIAGGAQDRRPVLPIVGGAQDRRPVVILHTQHDENDSQISPDGKWIAYSSNESGRFEVYVQPFLPSGRQSSGGPSPGGKWQVSTEGGVSSRWRADGKELFFLTPDKRKTLAVDVRYVAQQVESDKPHELFAAAMPTGNAYPYDVTADGQRFLVQEVSVTTRSAPLTVVVNWLAVLGK